MGIVRQQEPRWARRDETILVVSITNHHRSSHSLSFSWRPLFALRILLRECETLLFGTARTMGGRSSRMDPGSCHSDWKL